MKAKNPNNKWHKTIVYSVIAITIVFPLIAPCQSRIDSLSTAYQNAKSSINKVDVLNEMATIYFSREPLVADSITSIAISLSDAANYQIGKATALRYKGISFAVRNLYDSARHFYFLSLDILKKTDDVEKIAAVNYALGVSYTETNHREIASLYFNSALRLQKETLDSLGMANTYYGLGGMYEFNFELDTALLYLDSASKIYRAKHREREIRMVENRLSGIYEIRGDYVKSLELLHASLGYAEANDDKNQIAIVYNNLGSIYLRLQDYELAMKYFQKSYDMKKELGSTGRLVYSLNNIAEINRYLGNNELSLAQFREVVEIAKNVGIECKSVRSLLSIGSIYDEQGSADSSWYYYNKALKLGEECDYKEALVSVYLAVGNWLMNQNKENQAEFYLKKALSLAEELKSFDQVISACETLYVLSKENGNISDALSYLETSKFLGDSVYNANTDRQIARIESKYAYDKERTILEQQHEQDQIKQAALLEEQILIRKAVTVVLLLTIALSILIWLYYLKHKSSNLILTNQRLEIETQNNELIMLNNNKEKLLSLFAHDLKSPLVSLDGLFFLIKNNRLSAEKFLSFSEIISKKISNILEFVDLLLIWSKSNFTEIQVQKTNVLFSELISESIAMIEEKIREKSITVSIRNEENVEFMGDKVMLQIILRNLLSNAVKFSREAGEILLIAKMIAGSVQIEVIDHGVGMDEKTKDMLFKEPIPSSVGTKNEQGNGIGLFLSMDFIKLHHGQITAESELGKGTKMTLVMPIENA